MDQTINRPDELLTIQETIALIKIDRNTVYSFFSKGYLTKIVIGPRLVRILKSEIESMIGKEIVVESIEGNRRIYIKRR